MKKKSQVNLKVGLWILALAFLSVGARNFEDGLSVDGPLYAALARNLARSQDWMLMQVGLPEYAVYADHTHFGFWLHALWLKVFPAQDWSIRIPSHLMYVVFLFGFWKSLAFLNSARVATLAVLLLWIWAPFSNYFSNFYLDPGALLFGSIFLMSLWKALYGKFHWAFVAGISLGVCLGYKGLTFLAFGPVAAMLCLGHLVLASKEKKVIPVISTILITLISFAVVVGAYWWAVKSSAVPDFFSRYWSMQISNRFAGSWGLFEIFRWSFWNAFLKDTAWVGILIFPALWWNKSNKWNFLIPLIMFVTVVLMYAPTERNGGQYWIMLFPWAAWLIAQFIDKLLQKTLRAHWISTNNLMFVSGTAAIVGVLLIQYLPFRTHSRLAPPEVAVIKDLPHYPNIEGVILDLVDRNPDFASASPLLWYLDRKIEYIKANEAPPKAKDKSNFAYVLRINDEKKLSQLQNAGWCAISETVHLPCQP